VLLLLVKIFTQVAEIKMLLPPLQTVPPLPLTLPCKPHSSEESHRENEKVAACVTSLYCIFGDLYQSSTVG
jgi:hypothetical protein